MVSSAPPPPLTPRCGENHVRELRGGGDLGHPAIVALQGPPQGHLLRHGGGDEGPMAADSTEAPARSRPAATTLCQRGDRKRRRWCPAEAEVALQLYGSMAALRATWRRAGRCTERGVGVSVGGGGRIWGADCGMGGWIVRDRGTELVLGALGDRGTWGIRRA